MRIFFTLLFTLWLTGLFGQGCSCSENFTFVRQHVAGNYPGFKDKVRLPQDSLFNSFTRQVVQEVGLISQPDSCVKAIYKWLSFFKDGHLQIHFHNQLIRNPFLYPEHHDNPSSGQTDVVSFGPLDEHTNYLRIASFFEGHYRQIDSVLINNRVNLEGKKNLILDLRGNEGGATFTYQSLVPYLYTDTIHYIGFDVLASAANIAAYQEQLKSPYVPEGQKPYIKANIDRMKESEGALVSLSPDYFQVLERRLPNPSNIAILVDGSCGSTTEHFLLMAQQSEKVTIMGQPTAGIYDYGDMRSFPFPCSDHMFFCATNRSRRIDMEQGIDNRGIQPDQLLTQGSDWVAIAHEWLKNQ